MEKIRQIIAMPVLFPLYIMGIAGEKSMILSAKAIKRILRWVEGGEPLERITVKIGDDDDDD